MCTIITQSATGAASTGPVWILLADHGKAVRLSIPRANEEGEALALDFAAFGLADADQLTLEDGIALADWETAESEMHGTLKWDGCIDWMTSADCMMHGCGPGHIAEITAILTVVYNVGKRHMGLLDEDVPDMPKGAVEIVEGEGGPTPMRRIALA